MESQEQKNINKRKFTRLPASNEYTLILDGKQYQGAIGNISLGGVFLDSMTPAIPQSTLFKDCDIMMHISETFIFLSCSIAFIGSSNDEKSPKVGITFSVAEEKSLAVIANHIENLQLTDK